MTRGAVEMMEVESNLRCYVTEDGRFTGAHARQPNRAACERFDQITAGEAAAHRSLPGDFRWLLAGRGASLRHTSAILHAMRRTGISACPLYVRCAGRRHPAPRSPA